MPILAIANLLGWSFQVALLVVVAALAARLLPVDSAAVRHAWWRAVLVVCLALPLLQPWRPATFYDGPSVPLGFVIPQQPASSAGTFLNSVTGMPSGVVQPAPWPALVALVLAFGAAARLTWLAAGLIRLRRFRRAGELAGGSDRETELQTLIEAGAEIRYVGGIGQPVTFGLRRPVVLLPSRLRALQPDVQRAVIAHELWHVRRRDWAWVIVEEVLRAVLWFEPPIWWLISRVQATREEVVDELTVLLTNSRRSYLEALLAFADQPPLFPAASFGRRRHLYHRMLLISKEAVMSSKRIVASCAGMLAAIVVGGWYGVAAFPLTGPAAAPALQATTSQPRDPRPGASRPTTARETELQKAIRSQPVNAGAFFELAQLQERRGALSEAEGTLEALRQAQPANASAYQALASLYARTGKFDRAVRTLEDASALDPSDPKGHQTVAVFYWEKATKDQTLTPAEKVTYIRLGIEATDRAIAAKPDFMPALVYKNIFLRMQARLEPDPSRQQALIAEADTLRQRALALGNANGEGMTFVPSGSGAGMPPPPPPPPPPGLDEGKAPVRVGGNITTPLKIRDVKPVYPPEAQNAGVSGVVIIEAVIDEAGNVAEARVLRSIPLLDQAALDAVRQWKYAPTRLNGQAVPVTMTLTVNFSLQ